jgi:predicted Rossmann fold nucleotide-binding protein DprA/Smf involved in DNA uptake
LSKWKQEGDWENQRKLFNRHPLAMAEKINGIMEEVVNQIVKTGGKITTEQSDQLSKLSAVKKTLSSADDLPSMVIKVTDEFSQFIRRTVKDDDFAGRVSLLLAEFYQQIKEANYGS